jgi:hypothetical protein
MAVSSGNTIVQAGGQAITDANGNQWRLADGKVVVNDVVDQTTNRVILLAYENGKIWQENADRLWWSKTAAGDDWSPIAGTGTSPLPVGSPDNSVVFGSGPAGIIDRNADRWTITGTGQVAVNGIPDPATNRVIALAYENGQVWQENADRLWWSKSNAAQSWMPPYGTAGSPIPAGSSPPPVTYISGAVVGYQGMGIPSFYTVQTVDDGGKPIVFNYQGRVDSSGEVRNLEGDLILNVQDTLFNNGTLAARGSIGNGFTTINLAPNSMVMNTGLMTTESAVAVPFLAGSLKVTGAGQFVNLGRIAINAGTFNLDITGPFSNWGTVTLQSAAKTPQMIATTTDMSNTGTVESFSHLILAAGAAVSDPSHGDGTLFNTREIRASGDHGLIEIGAQLKQSPSGHIGIQDNATVKLDAASDGGTITITAGMLDFGSPAMHFSDPAVSADFHTDVVLNGAAAAFNFERPDLSIGLLVSSPGSADLLVGVAAGATPEYRADIHLIGAYHASQFRVAGNEVVYTRDA